LGPPLPDLHPSIDIEDDDQAAVRIDVRGWHRALVDDAEQFDQRQARDKIRRADQKPAHLGRIRTAAIGGSAGFPVPSGQLPRLAPRQILDVAVGGKDVGKRRDGRVKGLPMPVVASFAWVR
jgi:hypothetical protein